MKRIISILSAAFLLSLFCTASVKQKEDFSRKLQIFNSIVKELQTNYVDTLKAGEIMDRTIDALLYQIDPYTEYYPSSNQDEILSISSGQYAGIGSFIVKRGNKVLISEPQWNSPARKSGLKAGDVILKVNSDTVLPNTEIGDVSKRLRGQAGTEVVVKVKRPYVEDSLLTFNIIRDNIKVEPMPYFGIDSTGIGYIRLTTFNESSARRVKHAVTELMRDPELKGIVLDLRNNGGGLLESAVQIVGNFVKKGTEVLRTRGRNPKDEKIYKTTQNPIAPEIPLAVLVDNGTASASEIVSGALQDLDRAVIIGDRTFGKGLVQTTRPLPFGDILKITTGRYYIPSGRLIQVLDYSHRNPDGSPARVPDSLTHEFKTRIGRTVRDGGGIAPDIIVERKEANRLLYNILSDFWAFDFANKFAAEHPDSLDAETFVVTDEIFQNFKESIDPQRFKYDKQCESGLEILRQAAKTEGYMTDSVSAQFDILAALLKHDLENDLDINRSAIEDIIDEEISQRYFSDSARVKRSLRKDDDYEAAKKVLLDPKRYSEILSK